LDEKTLIEKYLVPQPVARDDVTLGIGDDAALVVVPGGHELVMTVDALLEGVHFDGNATPDAIGHKSLAVNLSDIAAMGAEPRWALMSLSIPDADDEWLRGFCGGFFALAGQHEVQLVGGDLIRGPRMISVQLSGTVERGTALRRDGARIGDAIFISGSIGDAAAALAATHVQATISPQALTYFRSRLDYPAPRIELGRVLRGLATAAIDLSDGLAIDLARLTAASGTGAEVMLEALPLSAAFRAHRDALGLDPALSGGDDYELCLTAPAASRDEIRLAAERSGVPVTEVGRITAGAGIRFLDKTGQAYQPNQNGYDHFARERG